MWIGLLALAATSQADPGGTPPGGTGDTGDAVLGFLFGGTARTGLPPPLADAASGTEFENVDAQQVWTGILANGEPRLLHSRGGIEVRSPAIESSAPVPCIVTAPRLSAVSEAVQTFDFDKKSPPCPQGE